MFFLRRHFRQPYLNSVLLAPGLVLLMWFLSGDEVNFWQRALALVALCLVAMPRLEQASLEAQRGFLEPSFWGFGAIQATWFTAFMVLMNVGREPVGSTDVVIWFCVGIGYGGFMMLRLKTDVHHPLTKAYEGAIISRTCNWLDAVLPLVFVGCWIGLVQSSTADLHTEWRHLYILVLLPFIARSLDWPKGSRERSWQRVTMFAAAGMAIAAGSLT